MAVLANSVTIRNHEKVRTGDDTEGGLSILHQEDIEIFWLT
jgi:hypothetical protein